jgi:hypothetical protein
VFLDRSFFEFNPSPAYSFYRAGSKEEGQVEAARDIPPTLVVELPIRGVSQHSLIPRGAEQVGFCGGMQAMPDDGPLQPPRTEISAQVPKKPTAAGRPPVIVTTRPG